MAAVGSADSVAALSGWRFFAAWVRVDEWCVDSY